MKSFSTGLVAAIIVGAIGLIVLRSMGTLTFPRLARLSPSPSASIEPNFELEPTSSVAPSPSPSTSPLPSVKPTTKGGIVLGQDTTPRPSATPRPVTTTTTTTTVTHYVYTLAKTSDCPGSITAELKDISSSLSVQYKIKDGYSAAISIWNENGVELAGQRLYTGNGKIADTGSAKSIKVLIQPNKCEDKDENWLEVIASR